MAHKYFPAVQQPSQNVLRSLLNWKVFQTFEWTSQKVQSSVLMSRVAEIVDKFTFFSMPLSLVSRFTDIDFLALFPVKIEFSNLKMDSTKR